MNHSSLRTTLQTTLCLLLLVLTVTQCDEPDPLDIPTPEERVELQIERLDQAWFDMTPVGFRRDHPRWMADYGELYVRYIEDILALGSTEDSNLYREIRYFTTDAAIAEVQKRVQHSFVDFSPTQVALEKAWTYYHFYFPDRTIPRHFTMIGGFNTPALLTPSGVAIGLEMFLGDTCRFYEYLQLPQYLRQRMTPQHIIPVILHGWLSTEFPLQSAAPTLIEKIIAEGKVLYAMDAILRDTPDHLKIFYSEEQLAWAQQHEHMVWAHFVDKELLFSNDPKEVAKFTNDGPFTVDLVKESPPRMGQFIGWMMVRAFMQRNPEMGMEDLMDTEPQTLLKESKYKP
jgi:hypothetical protein